MKVPYPAEMMGRIKNINQMGEACSLRFSARIQRSSMGHTSLFRMAYHAAKNKIPAKTTVATSSGHWNGTIM